MFLNDIINTLFGSKYFSELDLLSGYWQVGIDEADEQQTVFTVGNMGFLRTIRMGFGLSIQLRLR